MPSSWHVDRLFKSRTRPAPTPPTQSTQPPGRATFERTRGKRKAGRFGAGPGVGSPIVLALPLSIGGPRRHGKVAHQAAVVLPAPPGARPLHGGFKVWRAGYFVAGLLSIVSLYRRLPLLPPAPHRGGARKVPRLSCRPHTTPSRALPPASARPRTHAVTVSGFVRLRPGLQRSTAGTAPAKCVRADVQPVTRIIQNTPPSPPGGEFHCKVRRDTRPAFTPAQLTPAPSRRTHAPRSATGVSQGTRPHPHRPLIRVATLTDLTHRPHPLPHVAHVPTTPPCTTGYSLCDYQIRTCPTQGRCPIDPPTKPRPSTPRISSNPRAHGALSRPIVHVLHSPPRSQCVYANSPTSTRAPRLINTSDPLHRLPAVVHHPTQSAHPRNIFQPFLQPVARPPAANRQYTPPETTGSSRPDGVRARPVPVNLPTAPGHFMLVHVGQIAHTRISRCP
jgi:hypothetical protein